MSHCRDLSCFLTSWSQASLTRNLLTRLENKNNGISKFIQLPQYIFMKSHYAGNNLFNIYYIGDLITVFYEKLLAERKD
ncbi:hypothetical protein BpHYR1_027436 [Brachionus plicatilis]|uniref:Uncharacterized protein n=1 Tax=Brachionus plicatilis TaxID=10195 RepID=A0A3M7RWL0_BRAPC|nr:hypothetical protein BpHYR1_027436 [Brachionus plicatilis]